MVTACQGKNSDLKRNEGFPCFKCYSFRYLTIGFFLSYGCGTSACGECPEERGSRRLHGTCLLKWAEGDLCSDRALRLESGKCPQPVPEALGI